MDLGDDFEPAHGGHAMDTLKLIKAQKLETQNVSLQAHQHRYITEHSTCAMCDTQLEIHHEINLPALRVKEEAHCPSCGIRVRSSQHLMH